MGQWFNDSRSIHGFVTILGCIGYLINKLFFIGLLGGALVASALILVALMHGSRNGWEVAELGKCGATKFSYVLLAKSFLQCGEHWT